MICPHCSAEMHTDHVYADWACACGLAGPRDVLEALVVRLAERVMRDHLERSSTWRPLVEREAGGPVVGRAEPSWSAEGTPFCDDQCRYHDGKRCQLLGCRPSRLCEPVVTAMSERLDKAGSMSPPAVLAEAERLLRERDVHMVAITAGGVTLWGRLRRKIHSRGTLADAVARLEREKEQGNG